MRPFQLKGGNIFLRACQMSVGPETVREIVYHLERGLPEYVPAMPSILLGLVTFLLITVYGARLVNEDEKKYRGSKDIVLKTRWMVMTAVTFVIAYFVGEYVRQTHYMIVSINENQQHYANVHWLRLYKEALSPSLIR